MITNKRHNAVVSQLQERIEQLTSTPKPILKRKFTIRFKKRTVEVFGTGINSEHRDGFEVKTHDANGVERTAHFFAEKPVEWSSTWL